MKYADACGLACTAVKAVHGFRISFEHVADAGICRDVVPEYVDDEPPFKTEDEAWVFARKLAGATVGKFVNFYVIYAVDSMPVPGWYSKVILNSGMEVKGAGKGLPAKR